MIDPADISVVIQGPWGDHGPGVVESVRRVIPDAQVIVSTWVGSSVDVDGIDVLVENQDPGSSPYLDESGVELTKSLNTNRMLVSTQGGLARADRPYTLKLRSDSPVVSSGFLEWHGRFERRHREVQVFEHRLITSSIATRPPYENPGLLFHPSDCVHFGTTDDVRRLWNIPLIDEEVESRWLLGKPRPSFRHWGVNRYFNEQTLWLGALAEAGHEIDYPQAGEYTDELARTALLSIVNNFVVLEPWQLGVRLPTLEPIMADLPQSQYLWYDDWLAAYRDLLDD